MSVLLKNSSIVFFLSLITTLSGQVFRLTNSIPTTISGIEYRFLPVQSDNDFNFLFYSVKNKKQNFELITIKDTSAITRMPIKNKGLDGGGSWYKSAVMSDKKLLLLHVDGYLIIYEKDKKGNYALKKTLNIRGRDFKMLSLLDNETILLANSYNGYDKDKLHDNYALCVYNLQTNKIPYYAEMDLGKGILLSHIGTTVLIESKKDKIALAHPTLPFIYIYNENLKPIDTVHVQFQHALSIDSVINTVFSDSYLERINPKDIIQTINDGKIDDMERIEKVFWLSDDVLGYTIQQPFSQARMFVFYSLSEKRELYSRIYDGPPYNFFSSTRVLINNNKTIWTDGIYKNDKSDIYYKFDIFDLLPFNGAE